MMRTMLSGVLIAATVALAGCDDMEAFNHAKEDFHYSYALQPGSRLNIDNANGSIDVTGWDRNTIDISGTKYAATDERLRDVQIKIDVSGDTVRIRTETPKDFFYGNYGAKYLIRAPRQLLIENAVTTNGHVTIEDLSGGGRAHTTNGHITLSRDEGNYQVETTNGGIDMEGLNGSEQAETTNGAVHAQLKSGSLDVRSTNGGIDLTILSPQDAKPIRAGTTNGSITLALAEFHQNPITAHTTNGSITLRLPPDTNADVNAHNSHSSIVTDLPLSTTEEMSKHQVRGQLGKGGAEIEASTGGSIHIEKY